jgi:hypothetical protein
LALEKLTELTFCLFYNDVKDLSWISMNLVKMLLSLWKEGFEQCLAQLGMPVRLVSPSNVSVNLNNHLLNESRFTILNKDIVLASFEAIGVIWSIFLTHESIISSQPFTRKAISSKVSLTIKFALLQCYELNSCSPLRQVLCFLSTFIHYGSMLILCTYCCYSWRPSSF